MSPTTPLSQLSNHFGKLTATSPVVGRGYRQRSIVDDNRDTLLAGIPRNELSRLGSVVSTPSQRASPSASRRPSEMLPVLLKKPPKERLREWGSVYLGNSQQADVFVHAVPILRRSSGSGSGGEEKMRGRDSRRESIISMRSETPNDIVSRGIQEVETDSDHVIFRARVFPILKDRNPFTMQRKFARVELRNMALSALRDDKVKAKAEEEAGSTSKAKSDAGKDDNGKDEAGDTKMLDVETTPKGRSKSTPTPEPTGLHSPSPVSPAARRLPHFDTKRTVMPIHMDYALRYLPALGLLMLSGHIRKGDQIDLPIPFPEAWAESIAYVYTGLGEPGEKARANVEYLGGVVEVVEVEAEK